jgi:imidazolonepropionase-like amidohydrolase
LLTGLPAVSRHKNREVLESGQQAVELARAAGVSVGFGTDLMGLLEDEQLNGLRLQAEVDGIWTALASATSVNAELIGRPDLGRVAGGCTADLLILNGNVSDDPSVVWSPNSQRTIVQDGQVVAGSTAPVSRRAKSRRCGRDRRQLDSSGSRRRMGRSACRQPSATSDDAQAGRAS